MSQSEGKFFEHFRGIIAIIILLLVIIRFVDPEYFDYIIATNWNWPPWMVIGLFFYLTVFYFIGKYVSRWKHDEEE